MLGTKTVKIGFAGGGTGGHVYPLIAVAKELERMAIQSQASVEFHYFGPPSSYDAEFKEAEMRLHRIMAGKIRRYFSLLNITDVPKMFIGFVQAWFEMFFVMPDVLFSKGGSGAFPVVFAAWFYRVPVIIHDSDAKPGLNTLFSAPFAKKVGISFESARQYFNPQKVIFTGNPVRRSVLDQRMDSAAAKESLGFDPNEPLLFIAGGSQGSQRLDEFAMLHLKELLPFTQVLLQTGSANYMEVEKLTKAVMTDVPVSTEVKHRFQAVAYLGKEEWGRALAAADLALTRSGGSTIAEMAACGTPAILIPLEESAQDHQKANAYAYEEAGAGVVIEEANLNFQILVEELKNILAKSEKKDQMAEAARRFAKPEAASSLANEILDLI